MHPKPGAVTRYRSHADKDVITFTVHSIAVSTAAITACETSKLGSEDPIADGLEAYASTLRALSIGTNLGLGQALLIIPLASAIPRASSAEGLASEASGLVRRATPRATRAYYGLLASLSPRHLGRYRGPVPDVGSQGGLPPLVEVLEASSWDLVHSELLSSYQASREVASWVSGLEPELGLEGAAAVALLRLLASRGDTLIARTYGMRAYLVAREEAQQALSSPDPLRAAEELDIRWRARGWSPGAALDVLATGLSLYMIMRAHWQ